MWPAVGVTNGFRITSFIDSLNRQLAEHQFANDIRAMEGCDACVLLLPCGRSAHTEAGWFAGRGKKVFLYIPEKQEPELMYKLFDSVCCTMNELLEAIEKQKREVR